MQPIQNFNGYDRPWTGGNGTNQLDFDNASFFRGSATGTADNFTFSVTGSGSSGAFFALPDSFAGRTMYLSGTIERTGTHAKDIAVQLQYTRNGTNLYAVKARYTDNAVTLEDTPIDLAAGDTAFVLRILASADADDSVGETMTATNLRLCDETGQTWSPYANICPIYGHTAATATRIGANFLRPNPLGNGGTVGAFADGEYTFTVDADGFSYVSYPLPNNLAGKTVYLSGIVTRTGTHANNYAARIARRVNGVIGYQNFTSYTDNEVVYSDGAITIPEGATVISLMVVASAAADSSIGETMTVKDLRLCLAAGQPYTDYQRDDYTVSFGQTIYGGTLDFATGVLTSTMNLIELTGSETYTISATYGVISVGRAAYTTAKTNGKVVSNQFVYGRGASKPFGSVFISSAESGILQFTNGDSRFTDAESFAAFVAAQYNAGTPIQLCYELKEPVTIQLTPQEITTLLGVNNIWATTETNEP